ncbi:MAG: tail fiber domain-containing protein [Dysgonamonadaceae bacterium]|nr:tail fiber domain-containing protein [Dysgonamonadaceae bacterium]
MKTIQKTTKTKNLKKLKNLRILREVMSLISLISLMAITPLQAQVKIGQDAEPKKGAVLELNSNSEGYIGGLRLPNIWITDINVIPASFTENGLNTTEKDSLAGAIIYNTNPGLKNDANETTGTGVYYWTGTKWVKEVNNSRTTVVDRTAPITVAKTTAGTTDTYTVGISTGTTGQVLTTNASGSAIWANVPPPTVTVNNGLTQLTDAAKTIQLGGSLIQNTEVKTGTNSMVFSTNGGSQGLTIKNDFVGIGGISTINKFYVNGISRISDGLAVGGVNVPDGYMLYVDGGNSYFSNRVGIGTPPNSNYRLTVSEKAYVQDVLHVGGTTTTTNKLFVNGNTRIEGGLGVGGINPTYWLDVNGTSRFSGSMWINPNPQHGSASGRLGVGVAPGTNPDALVHIKKGNYAYEHLLLLEDEFIPSMRLVLPKDAVMDSQPDYRLGMIMFGRDNAMHPTYPTSPSNWAWGNGYKPYAHIEVVRTVTGSSIGGTMRFATANGFESNGLGSDTVRMTISDRGNVGIGIGKNLASTRLHIQTEGTTSKPVAGFTLVDGTQGLGKVLTSNASGVGTWKDLPAVLSDLEPWYERNTEGPATQNNKDAYLRANVALGFSNVGGFPQIAITDEGAGVDQNIRLYVNGNTVNTNDVHVHHRIGIGIVGDDNQGYVPKAALHIVNNHPTHGAKRADIDISTFRGEEMELDDGTPTLNFKTSRGEWTAQSDANVDDVIGKILFRPNQAETAASASITATYKGNYSAKLDFKAEEFYFNGTAIGSIVSDRRLKTNITPSKYGLSEIMQLQPVNYELKSKLGVERVGFIAQEVQPIIPEVVSGTEGDLNKGETLSIAYSELVPVLTKAIQEQQTQIESQQKIIEQLEARLKALEAAK